MKKFGKWHMGMVILVVLAIAWGTSLLVIPAEPEVDWWVITINQTEVRVPEEGLAWGHLPLQFKLELSEGAEAIVQGPLEVRVEGGEAVFGNNVLNHGCTFTIDGSYESLLLYPELDTQLTFHRHEN